RQIAVNGLRGRLQGVVDEAQEGRIAVQRPEQVVVVALLVGGDVFLQIVEAAHGGDRSALVGELQLLADLVLVDGHKGVGDLQLGGVEVDVVVGEQFAVRRDRLQRQGIRKIPCDA